MAATNDSNRPTCPAARVEAPWEDYLRRATRAQTQDVLRLALMIEASGVGMTDGVRDVLAIK